MAFSKILKAAYDYEAAAEDELSFAEGDVLGIVGDEDGEGWYYGCNVLGSDPEHKALIPTTYCEEMPVLETIRANYEYSAQEDNEVSFGEGQELELLHRIDGDWWLARESESGQCGMVPANYFRESEAEAQEQAEPEEAYEPEPVETEEYEQQEAYVPEPLEEEEIYDEKETATENYEEEPEENFEAPPLPPAPKNPVEVIAESEELKFKCDALFLDSKFAKTKGQLYLEKALYLCTADSIEHCYDLSELRDYDATELKMTLNSGEKVAIGLGKKDAKKFAELVHEISGYEAAPKENYAAEAPLPKAPTVVGPKMPESHGSSSKNNAITKTAMMVGVSFEGTEGEEISIFEGEEVYLLNDSDLGDSQFARIEKVNGVQGIVPRNFLMTRSEYQKKCEKDEEMKRSLEAEKAAAAEVTRRMSEVKVSESPSSLKRTDSVTSESNKTVSTKTSGASNSPWSALASGSSAVALPKKTSPASTSSAVKLENSRLWKDKSGKFQVEAEFISLSDGKVTILKASGSQVSVPLEILSDRDIEYACKRAGIPVPKMTKSSSSGEPKSTVVKGFDWLAFFLSVGFEAGKAREFGEKFSGAGFEESMISAFTSDFLTAQGMQMSEIYKLLPEAAKRKAQDMQASAKEKHRNNNSQVVLGSVSSSSKSKPVPVPAAAAELVPFKQSSDEQQLSVYQAEEEIQKFPTIEELELQGAIEVGSSRSKSANGKVTLPNGISVSKTSEGAEAPRVLVQPIETAKSSSSTVNATMNSFDATTGSSAIALMQQQMQNNAMVQMRMQAQAQAQMQVQMQMRAQAQAQYLAQQQHQQQMQQQRLYQMQQQQQQQPSVHITIHTGGDKTASSNNTMTPPMPLMMNQPPMMQMNSGMNGMMMGSQLNPMANAGMMVPMGNPMANPLNPFDPNNMNPFFPNNNNGFGF